MLVQRWPQPSAKNYGRTAMPDSLSTLPNASTSLAFLLAVADEVGTCVLDRTAQAAAVVASPHVYGGGTEPFYLSLCQEGRRIVVREQPGQNRLPPACPMRHVNLDGSFCLGWADEDPSMVRDIDGARTWWRVLLIYLGHQRYADACRHWPRGQERAHGNAAVYESRAEALAARFGSSFLFDLRTGRLRLRRMGDATRLERNGKPVFAIRDLAPEVANLRAACPCETTGRRQVLKSCSNHAATAAGIIRAMQARDEAEASFYRSFNQHVPCCGTMVGCPLGV